MNFGVFCVLRDCYGMFVMLSMLSGSDSWRVDIAFVKHFSHVDRT